MQPPSSSQTTNEHMTLYIITGPPAAGKSTWVKQHAQHGDITIDFDDIAATLTPQPEPHSYPHHIRTITKAARRAAIETVLQHINTTDVYIIHTTPNDTWMKRYNRAGAEVVTIDPGRDIVIQRCKEQRPAHILEVAQQWYADVDYVPFC